MSMWTHVTGAVYIDTFKELDKEDLISYIDKKLKNAPKLTGSESDAEYFINILSGYNVSTWDEQGMKEYQTCAVITLNGDLRDRRMKTTKNELRQFMDYISENFDIINYSLTIEDENTIFIYRRRKGG